MPRRIIVLSLLSVCLACVTMKPAPGPASGPFFQNLNIKISFSDGQGKQGGRVNWRFDGLHDKFIFFTPLNQVGLEMAVAGETALLLRPAKKVYWRGDFLMLLDRLWGIELSLAELKGLILDGTVPEEKIRGTGMAIELERGDRDRLPRTVWISRQDSLLTIKILQRETRPGRIVPLDPDRRFQQAALEDVLGDD